MPPRGRFVIGAWAVAFLFTLPVRAHGQKPAFVDNFIEFHSALAGTYGDEGRQVTSALDRMAAALDVWERQNQETELHLRARAGTTPADVAILYVDQLRLPEAIDAMQQAIAVDPQRASYYEFLGLLHQALGRSVEAGVAFDRARSLDPADPIAAYLAAAHLADRGGGDGMAPLVATLMAAAKRGEPARTWPFPRLTLVNDLSAKTPVFSPPLYADGFVAMAAGRFREAVQLFRAAAAEDPLVVDPAARSPQLLAGVAALRERRGDEAVRQLEAASASLPSSPEAHRILGVVYRANGRLAESINQFEAAVRLAPRSERARLALGSALMEAGRLEEAASVHRETIALLPASGDARWALAVVFEQLRRWQEAIGALEPATALTVMAGKTHLYWKIAQLAHAYNRDYPRVIALIASRNWLVLNEPLSHKDLGLAYHRAGRDEEALAELLMATLLGAEDGEMLSAMGQIHLAAGRLEQAEARSRRAVALDPELPQARYVFGITLKRLGRNTEATEQLAAFKRLREAALEEQRRQFEANATAPGGPSTTP
jgi:tetratricopeptide (TPR) repeat protein